MTDAARKITLEDVARAAGVSRALASIVIREAPGASDASRRRVKAVADELGYRPDVRARLLARSRPRLLGLTYLVPALHHADLLSPIHEAADAAGYAIILGGRTHSHSERRAINALAGYRPDAMLLIAPEMSEAEIARAAEVQPVVVVGRRLAHQPDRVDVVRTDEEDGLRQAVEHLVGLGHTRIAHVDGGPAQTTMTADRRRFYRAQMTRLGLRAQAWVVTGGNTTEAGHAAAMHLLAAEERPTAVVAFNDESAWGVMRAAAEMGLQVPAQLSVVGYDGSSLSRMVPQELTTIHQDSDSIGRVAVERAIRLIEEQEGEERDVNMADIVIPPSFMAGKTTAAPPAD